MQLEAHREVLDEVERDIVALTEQLRELNAVAEYHAQKLGISRRLSAPRAPLAQPTNGRQTGVFPRGATRFKTESQRAAAYIVISEAQQPMRVADIARVMVSQGYPKPADMGKLQNSLFTTMTRDQARFKKVGVGLWDVIKNDQKENNNEEHGH